jgi:hypothetical protein
LKNAFIFLEHFFGGQKSKASRICRSPMPVIKNPDEIPMLVQVRGIVFRMIVKRNKIRVFIGQQKFDGMLELVGKIKIIVFGEIDDLSELLFRENINLFIERGQIADSPSGSIPNHLH